MKKKYLIALFIVLLLLSAGSFFNALRISNAIVEPVLDEYPLTSISIELQNAHTLEYGLFYRFFYKKPGAYDEETAIFVSPVAFEVSTNPTDLKDRVNKMVRARVNPRTPY